MKRINVFKINDEVCLSQPKYELWKNGVFYTSNISLKLKNQYVNKFVKQGYQIFSGMTKFPFK